MAHKFKNKLNGDLQVGHAYLIRLISTKPVKESANLVAFYLGEQEGYPAFTPILDDTPAEGHEATLGHEIYTSEDCSGSVTVVGRFVLQDCDPANLTKGGAKKRTQKVLPKSDDTVH